MLTVANIISKATSQKVVLSFKVHSVYFYKNGKEPLAPKYTNCSLIWYCIKMLQLKFGWHILTVLEKRRPAFWQ